MDKVSNSDENDHVFRPSPTDFDVFLPWACCQLEVEDRVQVCRIEDTYTRPLTTDRMKRRKSFKGKEDLADGSGKTIYPAEEFGIGDASKVINIYAAYDNNGYLTQIKFLGNSSIPRKLFKLIANIISYHPHLTSIIIDRGLKQDGVYEICQLLSLSKITELILDNNVVLEANYYMLLEDHMPLKYLSLARCKLNDAAIEHIASKLLTSSLCILNLSSNRITDDGAISLGTVLRSNRKLRYLNLAGNMITDIGAASILKHLMLFPLDPKEVMETKARHFAYLKKKNDITLQIYNELRDKDAEKKVVTKKNTIKSALPNTMKKTKGLDDVSVSTKQLQLTGVNLSAFDSLLYERAEITAKASLGLYKEAFSSENTVTKDDVSYCLGNNILAYLNLAYNNLSYLSVKKLYQVISEQDDSRRVPRGLVNVCIEGNNIPESCYELTEIDYILQSHLATAQKASTTMRKKTTARTDVFVSPLTTERKVYKPAKGKDDTLEADEDNKKSIGSFTLVRGSTGENVVIVQTVYDSIGRLVKLKLQRNLTVPRSLMQIIFMLIPYHPHLKSITIDKGLQSDGIYELNKIISLAAITELILDGNTIEEANYYILLDNANTSLKYLSLARCNLNDKAVEALATKLLTSSLSILSLTSNIITDIGANHIGKVLKFNRKLSYLNLAGNMITDTGAASILDSLMKFPVTLDEITEKKSRHMAYLKLKNELIMKKVNELRTADLEKKNLKKKQGKPISTPVKKQKGVDKEGSVKNISLSVPNFDRLFFEKAEDAVKSFLGSFEDPFGHENMVKKDGIMYCLGNNKLRYLNLAYNNLSYLSVKKLFNVLTAQDISARNPKGLVNVCIDGNNLPQGCPEMTEINLILEAGLALARRSSSVVKKRPIKLGAK